MHHARPLRWQIRGGAALLILLSLALHALFPRPAWAACGPLTVNFCIDNAEYSFYYLLASLAWSVNRWLLILAYQLDQLRSWLIIVAFTSAYQWVTNFVRPVYIPVATAALLLASILFMLVPLTGRSSLVSMRHVLIWAILTPLILTLAGQMIGQAEQLRSSVSAQLFTQMSSAGPGAIFGAAGSDMPAPTPLYPSAACGATLTRSIPGMAMDSFAAAAVGADVGDLFCPEARGPSREIPDSFYTTVFGFAYDGYVGDLDSAVESRGWVEGMQRGMIRLLQTIIPSFLAVLESLIHLVFSLSMAVLWLSIPISLIFVWFQQSAAPLVNIVPRVVSVFMVSWTSSLLMGLVSAALLSAAQLGNATAFTGLAVGGLFILGYLTIVAFGTMWKSVGTIEQTALAATGLSVTQPVAMATSVAAGAAGMVTGGAALAGQVAAGGAGMAIAGGAALAQTQDAPLRTRVTYAAGAMAGRLAGVGAMGEVAAAMGWVDSDSATARGVYAGDRSSYSWRSARIQMERDGKALHGTAAPSGASQPSGGRGRSGGSSSAPPPVGPSGTAGPTGGTQGPQSQAGAPGPRGPQGQAGQAGAPGPQGQAGHAGVPGEAPPPQPGSLLHAATGRPAPDLPTTAVSSPADAAQRLEATDTHRVYAAAQVGSLRDPTSGADWQYVRSVAIPDGYQHTFQHPQHPVTQRPEVRQVTSRTRDLDPSPSTTSSATPSTTSSATPSTTPGATPSTTSSATPSTTPGARSGAAPNTSTRPPSPKVKTGPLDSTVATLAAQERQRGNP